MNKKTRNYQNSLPYPTPRGMDLRGEGEFSYLENMYVDRYTNDGSIESVVGYRRIRSLKKKVHSLAAIGSILLIHSGDGVYLGRGEERDAGLPLKKIAELCDCESYAIPLGDLCIFSDGRRIILVNSEGKATLLCESEETSDCKCGVIYDGRIFLSGNPKFKGKIFYTTPLSEENPVISGSIEEDIDCGEILSLINIDGFLAVLHSEGIIFHRALGSDYYPAIRIVNGIKPCSIASVYNREIVFMTRKGLMAMDIPAGDYELNPTLRSDKINRLLLKENPSKLSFCVWMGYLVISAEERIYLAYPDKDGEYEWYLIQGVGAYKNDRQVYRYRPDGEGGFMVHSSTHGIAVGEIYSYKNEDGKMIYYSKEKDGCYSVYRTSERTGGDFYPRTHTVCRDDLMWFSSEEGIYLFNNDKRGVIPATEESEEKYTRWREVGEGSIHPIYYSFAGHSPRYVIVTGTAERRNKDTDRLKLCFKKLSSGEPRLFSILDGKAKEEKIIRLNGEGCSVQNTVKAGIPGVNFVALTIPYPATLKAGGCLGIISKEFASPFGIKTSL